MRMMKSSSYGDDAAAKGQLPQYLRVSGVAVNEARLVTYKI